MTLRTLAAILLFTAMPAQQARAADDPALLAADAALVQAVARGDRAAAAALLDAAASWTDARGRTVTGAAAAQAFASAKDDERGAQVRRFDYDRVAVVQVDRDKLHRLRVWVKRPGGWRLLVQQDVRSLDAPPTATPGTGKECDNPCKRVPYEPKSANERAVIAAYQSLETAAHGADQKNWGTHVADEFILVSSNSDRTFDKPTRLAAVGRSSFGGVSPTRLLTAEMFDFGTVVVMRSQHEPDRGDRLQITRVWVKRNDVWGSTLSYQTSIRPAS
jgi:hypothetical protein